MQGSHKHIPGTNHVPREYIVAAILSLLFMVPLCLVPALALLFFYVSTYCYYYLLQLSCHPVTVVLTLVQTKEIRINIKDSITCTLTGVFPL